MNLRKLLAFREGVGRLQDDYGRAAERSRETAAEVARLLGDALTDGEPLAPADLGKLTPEELTERGYNPRLVQRALILAERLAEQRGEASKLAERLRDALALLARVEAYAGADS